LPLLENLIRRVVRDVVHEELSHLPCPAAPSILDDWSQEGQDDIAGDRQLLREASAVLEEYGDKPEAWIKWEDSSDRCASAKGGAHANQ